MTFPSKIPLAIKIIVNIVFGENLKLVPGIMPIKKNSKKITKKLNESKISDKLAIVKIIVNIFFMLIKL